MSDAAENIYDDEVIEDVVETTEQAVEETTEEVTETESKGEEETETPSVDEEANQETEPQQVPMAALHDERRKRQALEERLAQVEQNQPKQEAPDFWDNPEGVIDSRLSQVTQNFENRFLNMSENSARSRHKDFDEMNNYFFDELSSQNPALGQEALSQADPYEFIYQVASKAKLVNEVGDLDTMREKMRAELKAEMEAEKKAEIEKAIKERDLPSSLSNTRAANGNSTQTSDIPTAEELYD